MSSVTGGLRNTDMETSWKIKKTGELL